MRIGIDARFAGPLGTGIGKYLEKLITNLQVVDDQNQYFIFLKRNNWDAVNVKARNFKKVLADVSWYSLNEQIKLPGIYNSQNLDLLHVPHFNVPIFYKGKFIVTIHDLIHSEFTSYPSSTKNPISYKFKRFGYETVLKRAIFKSQKIITPSKFVKSEIQKKFKASTSKIHYIYEAPEEDYFKTKSTGSGKYLIYVGNLHPHKDIPTLLKAIKMLKNQKLTIVSPENVFLERTKALARELGLKKQVAFRGFINQQNLLEAYTEATAYVTPSLSEGFGIPPLNAMAASLPVICTDIPIHKEIYKDAAIYFKKGDANDLVSTIKKLSFSTIRSTTTKKGQNVAKSYSWEKMTMQTVDIYNSI